MDEFQKVNQWHDIFDPSDDEGPHALSKEQSYFRTIFMIEECMEFLAANRTDEELECVGEMIKQSIDKSIQKIKSKHHKTEPIIDQSDALIDLLYFVYGSFSKMEIDPEPIFDIVHRANMQKCFPNGKPHYDKETGKVLKPADWEEKYAPERHIKLEIESQRKSFKEEKKDA